MTNNNKTAKQTTAKSWTQLLKDMSQKKDGTGQTYREGIIKQVLKQAIKGDKQMISLIWDRLEGRPVQLQRTDLTTGGESLNATVNFVDTSAHILDNSKQSGQLEQGQDVESTVQNLDSVQELDSSVQNVDSNMPICEYSNMQEGDAQPPGKNESDNCDTTTPKISPNQLDTSKETE